MNGTWTLTYYPDDFIFGTLYAAAYSESKFLIVDTGRTATSSDRSLSSWDFKLTILSGYLILFGVTYGNNQFVDIGKNGTVLISKNGKTWTLLPKLNGVNNFGVIYIEFALN
ncbi:MAG: hypothetical protein ACK5Z5_01475 [Neisseriaceae bacterium]